MNEREYGYSKRVKHEFPEYQGQGFRYDMSSTEGCIVIPIFEGFEGVYPAYHINSTCWAFHSLLVNTNVIEKQIPLFFYIEQKFWEPAVAQLKRSGIPEERLIQWQAPPRLPEYKGQYFAQKLFTTLDPFFETYGTVVMVDGDTFLATARLDKFDISRLFGKLSDPTNYATAGMTEDLQRGPRFYIYYDLEDGEDAYELWKSLVREHLGLETDKVHRSDGGFNAWYPKTLKPTFKDFIRKYAKYFGSEEDVNSLYVQYTGERMENLNDIWDIRILRPGPGIDVICREESHIFFHLRIDRMKRDDDIEYFRRVIGQHKELS